MSSTAHSISPARAAALAQLERHLREQAARTEERLREMESTLADLVRDRGTIQEDRDAARQLVDAVHADLRLLGRAITRFDEHRYGWCITCGELIPIERLEAIPTAERCARCV